MRPPRPAPSLVTTNVLLAAARRSSAVADPGASAGADPTCVTSTGALAPARGQSEAVTNWPRAETASASHWRNAAVLPSVAAARVARPAGGVPAMRDAG